MHGRELEDVTGEVLTEFADDAARLPKLVETPGFAAAEAYFPDYPDRVLASPRVRAFMYQLVRAWWPKLMVEIGTYFAGTTEIGARALWANGDGGRLVTTDPYGGHRVPGILAAWPDVLQEHVVLTDKTSMDFYIEFGRHNPLLDLAFIDGNHAYEFAFYDLITLGRWTRPGGLVVLDDCDQPGVFWAAKHFLELNPGWREIGSAFDRFDPSRPFETMRSSVPGVGYLILQAPECFEIAATRVSFTYSGFRRLGISGFRVHPTAGSGMGELHTKIFLRSFPDDEIQGKPQQLVTTYSAPIASAGWEEMVTLEEPFLTDLDTWTTTREAELAFARYSTTDGAPLTLAQRPELIVTD